MKITYYGHSCFGLQAKGRDLLFDPFISPNPLASAIDVQKVPADYILISHGHEDHVADAVGIAKRTDAEVISNFEIVSWFENQGVNNGHALNHGGQKQFDYGTVKYVNAIHSSVLPDGTYGGNPGGFVVKTEGISVYYAGDTALTLDMELLSRYENIDVAFLPIGDTFTMGVDDALRCAEMIDCRHVIGMHYNTFPPIEIDGMAAIKKFEESGKKLTLMEIGSTIEI